VFEFQFLVVGRGSRPEIRHLTSETIRDNLETVHVTRRSVSFTTDWMQTMASSWWQKSRKGTKTHSITFSFVEAF